MKVPIMFRWRGCQTRIVGFLGNWKVETEFFKIKLKLWL